MKKISVVIPVYGCPNALEPLHERLVNTLSSIGLSYEIILVNDSCPKGSWDIIQKICKKDKKVVGINLSRNFGQIHATNAGIDYASGDYVVLMDCDLQDNPENIKELYNAVIKGNDIVFAKRKNRKDSALTKFLSKSFYKVYNHFVDGYYDSDIGNFSIATKKVVDQYKEIKDTNKCFVTVLSWMGYKHEIIELEGDERFDGKSSYTFTKKVNMAIDMLTSESNKPLRFLVKLGFIITVLSFIFIIIQIIRQLIFHDLDAGWTSIIASIFFMGGLTLTSLGGVGLYVGNIFNQTKGKPGYLVDEILNQKK